jgi:uncharacterized membrane protein
MDQNWWRDILAAVRKSRLVKIALGILIVIWAVIGNWDLFLSELMPARWAENRSWRVIDVVEKTTGYFPWWVWLIVGTLIVVAASLAYAVEQKRRADGSTHTILIIGSCSWGLSTSMLAAMKTPSRH